MHEVPKPATRTKRGILCFGEALIDFLARPGDTPVAPRAFLQYAGGAPANWNRRALGSWLTT